MSFARKGTRKGARRKKENFFSSRFIFLFALSQFRGPDYLGAWNRLLVHVETDLDENGVVEYDDVIPHILLALRMVYEGCYRISIIFL